MLNIYYLLPEQVMSILLAYATCTLIYLINYRSNKEAYFLHIYQYSKIILVQKFYKKNNLLQTQVMPIFQAYINQRKYLTTESQKYLFCLY